MLWERWKRIYEALTGERDSFHLVEYMHTDYIKLLCLTSENYYNLGGKMIAPINELGDTNEWNDKASVTNREGRNVKSQKLTNIEW